MSVLGNSLPESVTYFGAMMEKEFNLVIQIVLYVIGVLV